MFLLDSVSACTSPWMKRTSTLLHLALLLQLAVLEPVSPQTALKSSWRNRIGTIGTLIKRLSLNRKSYQVCRSKGDESNIINNNNNNYNYYNFTVTTIKKKDLQIDQNRTKTLYFTMCNGRLCFYTFKHASASREI